MNLADPVQKLWFCERICAFRPLSVRNVAYSVWLARLLENTPVSKGEPIIYGCIVNFLLRESRCCARLLSRNLKMLMTTEEKSDITAITAAPDVQGILGQIARNNNAINQTLQNYGYKYRVKTVVIQPEQSQQR